MNIATKTSIFVTIVLVIGFLGLWKVVDDKSTNQVEEQITNQMTDAVESRTAIMEDFVKEAEDYLRAYSKSDEVRDVFRTNESSEAIARAQAYTVEFDAVKQGIFEGIYAANTNTTILVHTNEVAVGKTTRSPEELPAFQADVFGGDRVTNYGIMPSRGTGQMCISMYYPIFENGTVIGYVGAAVFASKMMDNVARLSVAGLPESEYIFLNAETGEYLYNENEDLICTVTEDPGYLQMLDEIRNGENEAVGMVDYVDENGIEQIVVYKNIPERNWVFALKDTKANVFNSVTSIKKTIAFVCIAIGIAIIIILNIILQSLGVQLGNISKSIGQLGDMKLDANESLAKYSGRKDEVGKICEALNKTCNNLKQYIGAVDTQLSAMSDGDFTQTNKVAFVGEFVKLQESMDKIQASLRDSFREINSISTELVLDSQSVSNSAASLADAATKSNMLVAEIDEYVEEIGAQLENNAEFAIHAKDEANETAVCVEQSRNKMDELSNAMSEIEESTKAIEGISNTLEGIAKQTNILALNAMVEASSAGDAGRGFGVVANEIRRLAEQSSVAASNAYELIAKTITAVNEGMAIREETANYLDQVVVKADTIDTSVSKIAEATSEQSDKLKNINNRLREISYTVETTAAMAEQSAAASIELDDQINSLRENISKYHV